MDFNISDFRWINKPGACEADSERILITTEPETDFWQRTYYGFSHDSAHAFIMPATHDFTFSVKARFEYGKTYDQCGVVIYQNSDTWFKASVEFENDRYQRLGSVVTNDGYSDWATSDISSELRSLYYRLSRRGADFRIENSLDGIRYQQMRIFHLGGGDGEIHFGVYACSPLKSSFDAVFTEMKISESSWERYINPDACAGLELRSSSEQQI
jgi:uncharacterized protein